MLADPIDSRKGSFKDSPDVTDVKSLNQDHVMDGRFYIQRWGNTCRSFQ